MYWSLYFPVQTYNSRTLYINHFNCKQSSFNFAETVTGDLKTSWTCVGCDQVFLHKYSYERHMDRNYLHAWKETAKFLRYPRKSATEGSQRYFDHIEGTRINPEAKTVTWSGHVDREIEKVTFFMLHGIPILWKDAAKNAQGLRVPQIPALLTSFPDIAEHLLGFMSDPDEKLDCKSARFCQVSTWNFLNREQ